jgi:Ni/Fe-hydrogenase subunit HybB-like protein
MSSHGTWQRAVPVYDRPLFTKPVVGLLLLAATALGLSAVRVVTSLNPFSAMTDFYPWGIWKPFNTMVLTALGSGGLAVGLATWIFGKKHLHTVMRPALLTSFLFYSMGMALIAVDVGRPWNFWNIFAPWRWNLHSSLFEVLLCMTTYVVIFLIFENIPWLLERMRYRGGKKARERAERWMKPVRKVYPFMLAGAYLLPAMHQSSLGALMLLGSWKVHPLWQSQWLPGLYLIQAIGCGFGAVIIFVMVSCLAYRRPLDMKVLGDLGSMMSWTMLLYAVIRVADLAYLGRLGMAFAFDYYSWLFLAEMILVVVPALLLRARGLRETPRHLFSLTIVAVLGGMLYRFSPTTLSWNPGEIQTYFPSFLEILISLGWTSLALALYVLAVKAYAILPAPNSTWYDMVTYLKKNFPERRMDEHGNPTDD